MSFENRMAEIISTMNMAKIEAASGMAELFFPGPHLNESGTVIINEADLIEVIFHHMNTAGWTKVYQEVRYYKFGERKSKRVTFDVWMNPQLAARAAIIMNQ